MVAFLLRASSWFFAATAAALLALVILIVRGRRRQAPWMTLVPAALSLFWGLWFGIMATGHLTAVTIKLVLGILPARIHLWIAYPVGVVMFVPAWWLVSRIGGLMRDEKKPWRVAIALSALLALSLVLIEPPFGALVGLNVVLLALVGRRKGFFSLRGGHRQHAVA